MPLVWIYSNSKSPGKKKLEKLSHQVTDKLNIARSHCWVMWIKIEEGNFFVPHWECNESNNSSPIISVHCKSNYSMNEIKGMIQTIKQNVIQFVECNPNDLCIGVLRYNSSHLFIRGQIWEEEFS